MDFYEEHKALIITILLFSVLFLGMYNINIFNSNQKVRETLIELNDLRPQEPLEKQEQEMEPEPPSPKPEQSNLKTHQAFNQNQEESREDMQSRLEEIFEKNSASQEASEEENATSTPGDYSLSPNKREKTRKASEGKNTSEKTSVKEGTLKSSSISFSLVGRSAIDIPNPVYTCDVSGKVVVNIVVNATGEVTSTSVNKNSSTSTNECLIENALLYAAGARFSRLAGRNDQPGTITYNFQG